MSDTFTVSIGGTPIVVQMPENTAEAVRQAAIAVAARDGAQAAASAALAAAGVGEYADTGAGLAATAEGETFWVDNGDGTGTIYRHDAGPVATETGKFIKDPTGSGAAALLGKDGGGYVQEFIDKIPTPITGAPANQSTNVLAEEYLFTGCVLRQATAGGGWALINDLTHVPVGITSLDVNVTAPLTITLFHNADRGKNVWCSAWADETYSQMGLKFGVSSALDWTKITVAGPFNLRFTASTAPALQDGNGFLRPSCTVAWIAADKEWEITHPTYYLNGTLSATYDNKSGIANAARCPVSLAVRTVNANTMRVMAIGMCNAKIVYNGASFDISDGDAQLGGVSGRWSATWNGNRISVTHPAVLEEDWAVGQILKTTTPSGRTIVIDPLSTTTCDIYWYDSAGTLITAPDTDMALWLDRGRFIVDGSYSGHINLIGPDIRLDPAEVFNANANIWVGAIFMKP